MTIFTMIDKLLFRNLQRNFWRICQTSKIILRSENILSPKIILFRSFLDFTFYFLLIIIILQTVGLQDYFYYFLVSMLF